MAEEHKNGVASVSTRKNFPTPSSLKESGLGL